MKKFFAGLIVITVLSVGTTFANGGIIIFGKSSSSTAASPCTPKTNTFGGRVLDAVSGVIIFGKIGIIIFGKEAAPANCGR